MWAGVIAFAVGALAALFLMARAESRRERGLASTTRARAASKAERGRLERQAQELEALAQAAFGKAQHAAVAASAAAAELERAGTERDAAWQELECTARRLAEEGAKASQLAAQMSAPDAEQREVSRAARAAYRRGDISIDQLRAVWQLVDGWDSARQERSRALSRLRAQDANARRGYELAATKERAATRAAELAQIAADALIQEAVDAAADAQEARVAADAAG
jgi:hypothetical protein